MAGISVIINTLNEEDNIQRAINSVKWADEIIVCDMHSGDKTVEIAEGLGAKVIFCKRENYVEPARNFAISQATNNWILILDADEEIPEELSRRLKDVVLKPMNSDFVEIPRKNIIFGKWIEHTGWWPDYQIRFFKKDTVLWNNAIHSKPQTKGPGLSLPAQEKWAIVHNNYQTIGQFVERMNRYSTIQAEEILKEGYNFNWLDLLTKPLDEFLSRFFALKGFEDGLHGLSLSLLQAFSQLVLYLKVWEGISFKEQDMSLSELKQQKDKLSKTLDYWFKR